MAQLEKVTAFIARQTPQGMALLLLGHPTAGIQIPAGTVENGETPGIAVMREASEETGLTALTLQRQIGYRDETPPEGQLVIAQPTRVYSRPDLTSYDWAYFRRGVTVSVVKRQGGFAQVDFIEFDRFPDPQYVMYRIVGWVPENALAETQRRYFFLLDCPSDTPETWTVTTDYHTFSPFWAPLDDLPQVIPPQDEWLKVLFEHLPEPKQNTRSVS